MILTMNQNYKILIEMRDTILEYLEEQKSINEDALKAYEPMPIQDNDPEVKLMRERERIKINDRVYELKRHIGVIKRMYPNEK
jgi:membrane peptidoglycan carboxypeptidase